MRTTGPVAQWIEHPPSKRRVAGSIPAGVGLTSQGPAGQESADWRPTGNLPQTGLLGEPTSQKPASRLVCQTGRQTGLPRIVG